jgi:hypothetical protein
MTFCISTNCFSEQFRWLHTDDQASSYADSVGSAVMLRCGESGFLSTPIGASAFFLAALLACSGLILWARRPGHPDRGPVLVAAVTLGVVTGVLNLVLGTTGIWQSCSYRLPLLVVATFYVLLPIVGGALVLAGYRWLARRRRRAGVLYGAFILVVIAPLIALGDTAAIENGILAIGGGYTVWMDVVLGVALLWLPVGVYVRLRSDQ